MKIALVQQHASHDPEDNRERGRRAFLEAAGRGARLVAFAELAFSRFYPQVPAGPESLLRAEPVPGPTTEVFSTIAKETGVVAVLNLFERDGDRTYDSSPVIDADGRLLGVTRMVHIMEGPGFHERGYYSPGDRDDFVFETAAGRVGVAICYDRHFPECARILALKGAEILFNPSATTEGKSRYLWELEQPSQANSSDVPAWKRTSRISSPQLPTLLMISGFVTFCPT